MIISLVHIFQIIIDLSMTIFLSHLRGHFSSEVSDCGIAAILNQDFAHLQISCRDCIEKRSLPTNQVYYIQIGSIFYQFMDYIQTIFFCRIV